MYKPRFNLFIFGMVAALIFFQYRLWFQSGGIMEMQQLKKQLAAQTAVNTNAKAANTTLMSDIKRLKNNDEATEARARTELGMIKQDETYYRLVGNDK